VKLSTLLSLSKQLSNLFVTPSATQAEEEGVRVSVREVRDPSATDASSLGLRTSPSGGRVDREGVRVLLKFQNYSF
jgi:hypothetical protein